MASLRLLDGTKYRCIENGLYSIELYVEVTQEKVIKTLGKQIRDCSIYTAETLAIWEAYKLLYRRKYPIQLWKVTLKCQLNPSLTKFRLPIRLVI